MRLEGAYEGLSKKLYKAQGPEAGGRLTVIAVREAYDAAGILMSRLHAPGVLLAVDAIASTYLPEPVNPGWARYDTLTYLPGLRAGRYSLAMPSLGAGLMHWTG